jgi:UDP-glucose 4-epimerase
MTVRRRVLLTGAQGFIGRVLRERLLKHGYQITCYVRNSTTTFHADERWFEGDLREESRWETLVQDHNAVVHLAWTSVPATALCPARDLQENVVPTIRLASAAAAASCRFVFASSGGTVYGLPNALPLCEDHPTAPINAYGCAKLAAEGYLRFFVYSQGLNGCILRFANAYGRTCPTRRSQGAPDVLLTKALQNEPFELFGNGSVIRDYVHVDDIAASIEAALAPGAPAGIFNVGTGIGTSLAELIDLVERVTDRKLMILHRDPRPLDVPANILRVDRARAALQWSPQITLEDGLRRSWEAFGRLADRRQVA